jgi:hypothetical protein
LRWQRSKGFVFVAPWVSWRGVGIVIAAADSCSACLFIFDVPTAMGAVLTVGRHRQCPGVCVTGGVTSTPADHVGYAAGGLIATVLMGFVARPQQGR